MPKKTAKPKTARDKLKLGIIPVLAVTLFVVLRSPEPDAGDPTGTAAGTVPISLVGGATAGTSPVSTARRQSVWPQLSLQQLLDHNPFALPEQLAPPKPAPPADEPLDAAVVTPADDPPPHEPVPTPEEIEAALRQELLEQLQETEMTAFYQSQRGSVAIVGDKVLREGDVIDGAVKVVKIRPDRVIYRTLTP